MLNNDFDLSKLADDLPNSTYNTSYVYVRDVPRIDNCFHALFIVPEQYDEVNGRTYHTISNADILVEFLGDTEGTY